MPKSIAVLSLLLAACLVVAAPLAAHEIAVKQTTELNYDERAVSEPAPKAGVPEKAALGPLPWAPIPATIDPTAAWQETWICRFGGPAEVQGYQVQCNGATFLDFHIADCCIPGDHWQLKGKNWDVYPNTGVTTAPGPANGYGVPGRVYNYGGTVWNPGNIDAYIECTYPNGVDVFLADSFVSFSSDGACVVTPDTSRRRIDRAP